MFALKRLSTSTKTLIPSTQQFSSTRSNMGKILLVLYDGGKSAEEEPRLLGTIQNKLGIADWLKEKGHELVTTADKEGEDSEFRKHIKDAEVLITTPFHPGYLTREVMDTAKNLKLCITAGVGSDHVVSIMQQRRATKRYRD